MKNRRFWEQNNRIFGDSTLTTQKPPLNRRFYKMVRDTMRLSDLKLR